MAKAKHSVRKFMLMIVGTLSVAYYVVIKLILTFGLGYQGALALSGLMFPFSVFIALYGFYKGLIRHFGLEGDEKLFLGKR